MAPHFGIYEFSQGLMDVLQENYEWGEVNYLRILSEADRLHRIVRDFQEKRCSEIMSRSRFNQWRDEFEEDYDLWVTGEVTWDAAINGEFEVFDYLCECDWNEWLVFSADLGPVIEILDIEPDEDPVTLSKRAAAMMGPEGFIGIFFPDMNAFVVIASPFTDTGTPLQHIFGEFHGVQAAATGDSEYFALPPNHVREADDIDDELQQQDERYRARG